MELIRQKLDQSLGERLHGWLSALIFTSDPPIPVLQSVNPESSSTVFGLASLSFESLIVRITLSGVTSDTLSVRINLLDCGVAKPTGHW